jgi:large subunit ribosomal protein L18
MITRDRRAARDVRKVRIRRRVRGSAVRPRLAVFRSLNHIYAQLVDDDAGKTVVAADSRSKEFRAHHPAGGNVAAAKAVGTLLAERARACGVERVVFDRGGYMYHGRVKALADAARSGGLVF